MTQYNLVRRDLEAARNWLDGSDEVDQHLGLVLDHVIETVLRIEHMKVRPSTNVVPFRSKPAKMQGRFTER